VVQEATTNLLFELWSGGESEELVESRLVPALDLWAMDVREPDFVRSRKQAVRIDGYMWRGVLGIAAALMILIAGELLLVGGRVFVSVLGDMIAKRENEVVRIEERHGIVQRLAEFDRSNLIPLR